MAGAKGEATRARLLASAEELFAAQGYHGTTVSQIVTGAGLTQASFYLYFPSKEELMNELLRRFEDRIRELGNAGEEAGRQPDGKLEAFATYSMIAMFKLLGENLNLTKIALQGAAGERLRLELARGVAVPGYRKSGDRASARCGIARRRCGIFGVPLSDEWREKRRGAG